MNDVSGTVGKVYRMPGIIEVTRDQIVEFADAIGDHDPAYRDSALAAERGHPDVPAPPTFLVRYLWRAIEPVLADIGFVLDLPSMVHRDQRFDFARPVFAGDRLVADTSLRRLTTVKEVHLLTLQCVFSAEKGGEVCRMSTSVVGPTTWASVLGPEG